MLTPELSICGYPAEDLLLRPAFIAACDDAVKTVARELAGLKGLHVVVGHPHGTGIRGKSVQVQMRYNAASVLCEGKVLETYAKRELPNYQVFDEYRLHARAGHLRVPGGRHQRRPADLRGRLVREPAQLARVSGARAAGGAQRLALPRGKAASASPAWASAPGRRTCR